MMMMIFYDNNDFESSRPNGVWRRNKHDGDDDTAHDNDDDDDDEDDEADGNCGNGYLTVR